MSYIFSELRKEWSHLRSVWVGLQQMIPGENDYVYSDGVASTNNNTRWHSNEPDNPIEEQCVATVGHTYSKLNSIPCVSSRKCICEL